jgi:hypothetical protein
MRIGLMLISIATLLLVLGEITFPFTSTITVKSNFTSPPWFTHGKVVVHKGHFTVFSEDFNKTLNSTDSITLKNNFTMIGKGNASITLSGLKIFYTNEYVNFSIVILTAGVIIEILRLVIRKRS